MVLCSNTLDDIRECLDWQYKLAMTPNENLQQNEELRARLRKVEKRLGTRASPVQAPHHNPSPPIFTVVISPESKGQGEPRFSMARTTQAMTRSLHCN